MQLSTQFTTSKVCNELSAYTDNEATRDEVKTELKKLIAAFPVLTSDFIVLLIDRITSNKFTHARVTDAINHIIDTCQYKQPSIAEIISYDKKIKVYTYNEIQAMCSPGYMAFEKYKRITINGHPRWIIK